MVVLSDHGMTSTDSRGLSVINLNHLIDMSDIRYMVYYGATSMLLPNEGKLEKVRNKYFDTNHSIVNLTYNLLKLLYSPK